MADLIRVHQALFGYHDGHNLVAASVSLSPNVRHFLATMTDASGAEIAQGFALAYTGLAVPQTDYYALFCTWPAPEMPRPGCVWSHVLLVNLADLARLRDLSMLRGFCQRPKTPSAASEYEEPITLPSLDRPNQPHVPHPHNTASLLTALYRYPERGIVVLAERSEEWEDTVFALWSQQWPRLRRNFAFSTGSFGDRRLAGVIFDLQIAPVGSERLWRRAELPTTVIEPTSGASSGSEPPWIRLVMDDLVADSSSPLREFLFTYGSDIEKPRHAFARLVLAYERLHLGPGEDDWASKLRSVGEIFPGKGEALRLKEWLVKPSTAEARPESLERAWATASFLLDAPEASAYSNIAIDQTGWAQLLWHSKRDDVLALFGRLVRQREKPATTAFAAAVSNILGPDDLLEISRRQPELIPIFVNHKPSLAHEVTTWQLAGHTQWQVYEVLERLSLSERDWSEIEAAMFIAATHVAVREVVSKAGKYAMEGAFRWLDNRIAQECLPSREWRQAIATAATHLLQEGNPLPSAQLAFCGWLIPPEVVPTLLAAAREDIKILAEQPLESIPAPLRSHTAFLLMTLGLRARGPEGLQPILRAFFDVHDELASMRFSTESWQMLSPELPRLSVWRDWDRCEKLRQGVRRWIDKHPQGQNALLNAAITRDRRELVRRMFNASNW